MKKLVSAIILSTMAAGAFAAGHAPALSVEASDQSVSNGVVSAEMIVAAENGWLVVHRTDADMAPGPVVGHAPLRMGENVDVAAILTEEVNPVEMLMLMVHAETGGMRTGILNILWGQRKTAPSMLMTG